MSRSNSRIPLVRTTCWTSNAIIGTFASSQNPKPLNDLEFKRYRCCKVTEDSALLGGSYLLGHL